MRTRGRTNSTVDLPATPRQAQEQRSPQAPACSAGNFCRDSWWNFRWVFSSTLQPRGGAVPDHHQDDCGAHLSPTEPPVIGDESQTDQSGEPEYTGREGSVPASSRAAQLVAQLGHAGGLDP